LGGLASAPAQRRAYPALASDRRTARQRPRAGTAHLKRAPFAQPLAQTAGLDSQSLADGFEGEWPVGAAVKQPCFGFGEHPLARAAAGVAASLVAAHRVLQHGQHQPLDRADRKVVGADASVVLLRRQGIGGQQTRNRAAYKFHCHPALGRLTKSGWRPNPIGSPEPQQRLCRSTGSIAATGYLLLGWAQERASSGFSALGSYLM